MTATAIAEVFGGLFEHADKNFHLGPLNLSILAGEFTSILGFNGSGKSTLLNILSGDYALSAGKIRFPGICGDRLDWSAIKRRVRFLRVGDTAFSQPEESVADSILASARKHGVPFAEATQRLAQLAEAFEIAAYRHYTWNELSDGYRQRATICRALVCQPALLLLDEPLANLDLRARQKTIDLLYKFSRSSEFATSVVLTSQDVRVCEEISDQFVIFQRGFPLFVGKPDDIRPRTGLSVYEVSAANQRAELADAIRALRPTFVHDRSNGIVFGQTHASNLTEIVSHLASAGVTVDYSRDLTRSPEVFFLDYFEARP